MNQEVLEAVFGNHANTVEREIRLYTQRNSLEFDDAVQEIALWGLGKDWNGKPSGYVTTAVQRELFKLQQAEDEQSGEKGWEYKRITRDDGTKGRKWTEVPAGAVGGIANPSRFGERQEEISLDAALTFESQGIPTGLAPGFGNDPLRGIHVTTAEERAEMLARCPDPNPWTAEDRARLDAELAEDPDWDPDWDEEDLEAA